MSVRRALVCAPLLPEYDRESGMQRTFHLIGFLQEAGFAVSFIAQNPAAGEQRYVRALQQRGVATYRGFNPQTDQLVAASQFDLAMFAFWHLAELLMPAIRRLSPSTRVIIDTIDLHFLRDARRLFHEAAQHQPGVGARGDEAPPLVVPNQNPPRAEGAFLAATPNPVPVGFAPGTTQISWSVGDGSSGRVYVSVDGGPEQLFAEGPGGAEDAGWIENGKRYEFLLYEDAEHGEPLASIVVAMNSEIGGLDSDYAARMVREVNTYAAADAVLAVSRKEAELINDMVGGPTLARTVPDYEDLSPSTLPFAERKGVLFVGNFRHPPNIDAAEYLCKDIMPRLDPVLLAKHPVYMVGNALDERVRAYARKMTHVRTVGWVPSVLPYFEQVRVTVVPLLYGGGTKRKLVQALMVGTPTVSTSIGIEGLNLQDGEHVLVADDPDAFAKAIGRLLEDPKLWQGLARQGQEHIAAAHGRKAARTRFMKVVTEVLSKAPKPAKLARPESKKLPGHRLERQRYKELISRVRKAVNAALPRNATVVVVSRGDDELLDLYGRRGWHFPQTEDGTYAGHYPASSTAAIAHLESLRAKGAEFLVFPATALWWLEHYPEFGRHLESRYPVLERQENTCLIYALNQPMTRNNRRINT